MQRDARGRVLGGADVALEHADEILVAAEHPREPVEVIDGLLVAGVLAERARVRVEGLVGEVSWISAMRCRSSTFWSRSVELRASTSKAYARRS